MAQANPLRRLPLRLPHLLGVLVVLIFLPWVLLTGKSEREIRRTIETFEPFQLPEFPLQFSRTMEYDSLGFLGRGVRAGFWKWTPEGMVLAEKGRAYFTQTPSEISTVVGAGRRVISKLQGFQDREGRREVRFRYRWTKVTPPAQALLSIPPVPNEEYEGRAVLVKHSGHWRVELLETPDFDQPMALLKDTSQGVRR